MAQAEQPRGARVRLAGVDKSFGARQVLTQINLEIEPGEFVTVVGQSGSGKSTLLRVLCGLEQVSTGYLETPASARVRMVFQEARLLPWRKVLANVCVGLRAAERRGAQVLADVGLAERAQDYPSSLSGGQKQRVSLARALLHEPLLMLLDEPFGALDALTRVGAQRLVERLWLARGFSALLVTHDVEEAVLLGDRVLVFEGGRIVKELRVDLPRPRTRDDPEVGRLSAILLDIILGSQAAASIPLEPEPRRDTSYVMPHAGAGLTSSAE